MAPVAGARCTECGEILRCNSLQLAGGAEAVLSYWCPNNAGGCYRYGVHVHTFRLGELPKREDAE